VDLLIGVRLVEILDLLAQTSASDAVRVCQCWTSKTVPPAAGACAAGLAASVGLAASAGFAASAGLAVA